MSQTLLPAYDGPSRVPDFFYDRQTEVIYFLKSINNKKIKFSTKVKLPDLAKAKRVANGLLKKKLAPNKAVVRTLIKDEIEHWFQTKQSEGLKYDTLNNVRRAKNEIAEYWGSMFPSDITRDSIAKWVNWFKQTKPDRQIENNIKYMRVFCRYLAEKVQHGYPLLPAVPKIKNPDYREVRAARKKKKEKILSHDDS